MPFSFFQQTIPTLHSAALILGAAAFLSRLLGLFRDRLLAATFGASRELDLYYAAFQIPDFIYSILLLGAASMAILPIFIETIGKNRRDAERFINELLSLFFIAGAALVSVGFFLVPILIPIIFPGFDILSQNEVSYLTRIMLISPLLLGLSSILTSAIQAERKFIAYAAAAILYNIGIIIGIIFFVPLWGMSGLAFGVILGALLHFLSQFFTYGTLGFSIQPIKNLFSANVKEVLILSGPRVLAASSQQIAFMILLGIASTLSQGSIAVFQFANNLVFLPVGIFGLSYATALFPKLTEFALARDMENFFKNLFIGIRTIAFWVVPCAFLFIVLRAHIVRVVLGAGIFDWSDTRLTAAVFAVLVPALIGSSLTLLFLRGFYALKSTWLPLGINIFSFFISIVGAFYFVWVLKSDTSFAHITYVLFRIGDILGGEILGISLGYTLGVIINAICLMALLFWLVKKTLNGSPKDISTKKELFIPLMFIFLASLVGAGAAYGILFLFGPLFALTTFVSVLTQGMIAGTVGVLVYAAMLYFLKSEDFYSISGSFQRKFFKLGILPQQWNEEKDRIE